MANSPCIASQRGERHGLCDARRNGVFDSAASGVGPRVAAAACAGAVWMAIAAPDANADSGSYQPALDQLLDAMQQAVAYDAGLRFATADSNAMLLTACKTPTTTAFRRSVRRLRVWP